jgi:hypothetical protein
MHPEKQIMVGNEIYLTVKDSNALSDTPCSCKIWPWLCQKEAQDSHKVENSNKCAGGFSNKMDGSDDNFLRHRSTEESCQEVVADSEEDYTVK